MDKPADMPTDTPLDMPSDQGEQNSAPKIIKTDISKLKLDITSTNNTSKNDVLEALKKQAGLENITESDFEFKLEKRALLNREGKIVIASNSDSELIDGKLEISINKLTEVTPKKHVYSADKTEVLEIGYDKHGKIEQFSRNVKKVPEILPEEVISLESAFDRNWSGTIQGLDKWDTSNIENMSKTFFGAVNFNTDISNWKTDKVKSMDFLFSGAKKFNKDLSKWNTSNVTNMKKMFQEAEVFDGNISSWNTQNVTDMSFMFDGAKVFNQDISSWNVDNVTTMEKMFQKASKFNKPIFKLVNPKVKNMQYMFYLAKEFNDSNISNWNTISVNDIKSMFRGADKFNQPLNWKTDNITDMSNAFADTPIFNGDITKWKTDKVIDMRGMFQNANSFNRDISDWNIKNVKNVSGMFTRAGSFSHSLKKWEFQDGVEHNNFANGSKIYNMQDKLPTFKPTKTK
ncbi:Hypothetical protein, DUF285 family [Mycoplasmopsis agalactiae 14628]|uniref:Uncharacterized protein n=1 Tax=Mycoplasmopsis agalactiae 14628 TaxID=1110504 RepID=I5D5K0_MYCAA|nr:BspA family leucine-rich repeat surface protein [Mycoplasmopsis agalactiae]EIN14959.1 Hypothetical protein, DUF285 family [Mycoplasmopsis agalactiae 14628]